MRNRQKIFYIVNVLIIFCVLFASIQYLHGESHLNYYQANYPFSSKSDSLEIEKKKILEKARYETYLRNWNKAIRYYKQYIKRFPEETQRIQKIIKILSRPLQKVTILNLGPNINSKYNEYFPIISTDGNTLFFTSRNRPGGYGGEDVWVSTKNNGKWTPAVNLGSRINTNLHEGFMNLSPDSTIAFIYGNYPDSYGNGDIYYSELEKHGWGEVKNLGNPINTEYFEADACLSSDGRTLFFVSDRPGVVGEFRPKSEYRHPYYNTDIFISFKTDSGWSTPMNLGDKINTPECERGPIFHPDGRTIFFCSSGHPGLGDLDIFVSYKIGDSWTEWSEPVNLGKEINTIYKDWGYSIPVYGNEVYFSSIRDDGFGKSDIYLMKLPKSLTKPVTIVTGKVTDKNNNPIEKVKITWEDLQSFKILGITTTRPNGDYTILLPSGRWYSYTATKDSFIFVSRDIDLRKKKIPKIKLNVELPKPIPNDIAYSSALLNVFFEINQSKLRPESKSELDRFLKLIESHPEWRKIEIGGHTCDLGPKDYNKILSLKRAQSVVEYLCNHGIDKNRLIAVGYGYDKPLVKGFTDAARKKNRRVEFKVVELDLETKR